jgi:excisionase family DNA binding protein
LFCVIREHQVKEKQAMANLKSAESVTEQGLSTIRQAEQFLASSRSTIYALMDRGELPYVKIGKSRRIPSKALREFAERCLVSAGRT